jgi:hypothetical protein
MELSPGHLNDEEKIQGQMSDAHVSRLVLDGEDACSGNSVQVTSKWRFI